MLFLFIHFFIMETMENIVEQSKLLILWCNEKIEELTQAIKEMSNYCKSPLAKPDRKKEMETALVIFKEQLADFTKIKQDMLLFREEIMVDSYVGFSGR